jgi:hypothetical protein
VLSQSTCIIYCSGTSRNQLQDMSDGPRDRRIQKVTYDSYLSGAVKRKMLHPGPLLIESEPRECREILSPRTPKGNMQRYADMSSTMDGIDFYENPPGTKPSSQE